LCSLLQPVDAKDSDGSEGGVDGRGQRPAAAKNGGSAPHSLRNGLAVAQVGAQHGGRLLQNVSVRRGPRRIRLLTFCSGA